MRCANTTLRSDRDSPRGSPKADRHAGLAKPVPNNVSSGSNSLRAGTAGVKVRIRALLRASAANAIGLAHGKERPRRARHACPSTDACPVQPGQPVTTLLRRRPRRVYRAFLDWHAAQEQRGLPSHIRDRDPGLKRCGSTGGPGRKQDAVVRELWRWFKPVGTARACLVSVEGGGGEEFHGWLRCP